MLVDQPQTSTSRKRPERPPLALTWGRTTDILLDCALEALVLAFLVQLMGGLVVGLVSGLWRDMTPSLPPFLVGKHAVEVEPSSASSFTWLRHHQFAILFGVLFAGQTAGQLVRYSPKKEHRDAAALARRVYRRISAQWFDLVVTNAFTAFIAVLVIQFTQEFSLTQWLWRLAFDLLRPVIDGVASLLPVGPPNVTSDLISWYNANQFKFTFWLLYSAAICDDLGLPNYKTLVRFVWRRLRKRKDAVVEEPKKAAED